MPDDKSGDESPRQVRQLVDAWSVGLMFPVAIAVGFGWGWGMDKLFGTKPWLTWIFTVLGVIAAFVNLFRIGLRNDGSGG